VVCDKHRVLPKCNELLTVARDQRHFFVRRDAPQWVVVNELGAWVLRLCNGRRSLHEIAESICRTYDRSLAEVQKDVLSFWSQLQASGFLTEPAPQQEEPTHVSLVSPQVYVTTRCNQSCSHCGVRGAFPEGDMPPELFREVVRQSAALNASKIVITGGEPLARGDLFDLLRTAEGVVPVQVLTNATLVDAANARQLASLRVAVQVSLDGGTRSVHDSIRGEGAFDTSLRALRLLRDSGVNPLTINFTIQHANANDLGNLLELAQREGIGEITLMPFVPGVEGDQRCRYADPDSIVMAQQRVRHYDGPVVTQLNIPGFGKDAISGQRWCSPGRAPAIGPDGSVFPCTPFAHSPFLIGKLPGDTLEQVLRSKVLHDLRCIYQERVDKIEECASCVWKHFCRAGCLAFAYHQQGTLLAKDCFCEARRRLYSDLFLGGQDNGDRSQE